MKKITVSAPGKLILLGEHAVVYNRPCLVTAVDQRLRLAIEVLNIPEFQLDAPDVGIINYKKQITEIGKEDLPKDVKFVEIAVKNFLNFAQPDDKKGNRTRFGKPTNHQNCHSRERGRPHEMGSTLGVNPAGINNTPFGKSWRITKKGIRITTKSQFSPQFGFGSSSASAVCAIKAMSELFKLDLTPKEIFNLSYKTVLDVQGAGSGFDVAAAVYGGTIYFTTGGKTIEPLTISNLPLIVGYSGIKADTVTLINQVKEKVVKYPGIIEGIYSSIEELIHLAKVKLLENDLESFGQLMDINQGYLEALGVSNNKLTNMIYASRTAGSYGAKLSGAGGGDCIIAITPEINRKAVEKAIIKAGGEVIKASTNAKGVKIES